MKHLIIITTLFALTLPCVTQAHQDRSLRDHSLYFHHIELEPGVYSDIHVRVFVNERKRRCGFSGKSAFAVHGVAHTAASWQPIVEELFSQPGRANALCRVYAIDLPGHGQSSLPHGMSFGDLLLEDLVIAVGETLERLAQYHIKPHTLLAHSQGGLLTQMLQQDLIQSGTSLRSKFSIKKTVLLTSTPGDPIDWAFGRSPDALATIGQLIVTTPERGTHVAIPAPVWKALFMTTFSGVQHPAAPEDDTLGLYSSSEPLLSLLGLVGAPPFARPHIDSGIFADSLGTRLYVISYSQDSFNLPSEQESLYRYLSNDPSLSKFGVLYDDLAVHDMHVVDPARVLTLLESLN